MRAARASSRVKAMPAAAGVERLQDLEAEEGRVAERSRGLAAVGRAQGVGAVLDHAQAVAPRDGQDLVHVAGQAVDVGGDDRPGARSDDPLEGRRGRG